MFSCSQSSRLYTNSKHNVVGVDQQIIGQHKYIAVFQDSGCVATQIAHVIYREKIGANGARRHQLPTV